MSIATLIMGESGSGKSTSLRELNPEDTLLIQAVQKPLPFRSTEWKPWDSKSKTGSIAVTDRASHICAAITRAYSNGKKIVVIDDWQYTMANEFMRRVTDQEKGNAAFQKFNEIARLAWDVIMAATQCPDPIRVYILTHTATDDFGKTKTKTIGKLLDEKITIEGLFSIVLRSYRKDSEYLFATQSNGMDTCKSPMGLFESEAIENNLKTIDSQICEYYGIQ